MIDGHIHFATSLDQKRLEKIIEEYELNGVALQCIPKGGILPVEEDAFLFKKYCSVPVYIFGGIDRKIYLKEEKKIGSSLVDEAKKLMDRGCDGIKMLEGKPNVRKNWPIPDFDLPVWEPYWDYVEKEQIPVYMHVNDPEEFWDAEHVSEFAKKAGWFYDDSYVNNEDQYRQILNVLERHPKLKILFPHFFFLSKQLNRLRCILDKFSNVRIDITPGVELFLNLSDEIEEARLFFDTYQNRILYGTDIGARQVIQKDPVLLSMEESRDRISLITRFLEEKGNYKLAPNAYYAGPEIKEMNGLGLDQSILRKIYQDNFLEFLKMDQNRQITC